MAALIEFVCIADHARRTDPAITLEQRAWAFCAAGASEGHEWTRIDPTAIETVRSRPSAGRTQLVLHESDEGVLSGSPSR